MKNKVVAEFSANGKRIQLIAQDDGRGEYIVFSRVLDDWDLDDVDAFCKKENAIARFLYLTCRLLIEE